MRTVSGLTEKTAISTGWPATMEGAVRSGYTAAGALLGKDLSVEEVPPTWLARLLGLR